MDPIESWVDVSELRRMADALLIRPEHPEESLSDPHAGPFGAQFEGFEAEPVAGSGGAVGAVAEQGRGASKARDALASARELARKGGLLEGSDRRASEIINGGLEEKSLSPSPRKEKAEEGLPKGGGGNSVIEGLAPFGGWLHDALGSRSYFLLERSGNVVVDEAKSEKLHHLARTLAQAAFTAKRQAGAAAVGNLHIKVEQGSVLEVIPVNTREGLFILGVLLARPLLPRQVETAARGLQQVIDSASF